MLKDEKEAYTVAARTSSESSSEYKVRSVTTKTQNESGKLIELNRPIVKLCPLPMDRKRSNDDIVNN